jgi:hypothetical protein
MADRDQVDFIFLVLNDAKAGKSFQEVACEYGVDESRLREWDKSFGGMTRAQIKNVRQLEDENSRLTRRVAELEEDNHALDHAFVRMLDGAI